MNIYLGSDHAGFELKERIKASLHEHGHTVSDQGCESNTSCDYPEFGAATARRVVVDPGSFGIVVCGSGIGISMAANKISGARCVLANSTEQAEQGREHNDANLLALGARVTNYDDPLEIVQAFLDTKFDDAERRVRRRDQLDAL